MILLTVLIVVCAAYFTYVLQVLLIYRTALALNNGYSKGYSVGFFLFYWLVLPFRKERCIVFSNFQHKIIFFSKSQPWDYS